MSFIQNMQAREKSLQEMCSMGKHEALHSQNCITIFVVTGCRPSKDATERVSQIGGKRRSRKRNLIQKCTYPEQPSCFLKEVAYPVTCPPGSLPFCYSFPQSWSHAALLRALNHSDDGESSCTAWPTLCALTRFAFITPPHSLHFPGAFCLGHCWEHMVIQCRKGMDWPVSDFQL